MCYTNQLEVGGPAQAPATGNFFFVFFGGKNLRREGDFFNAPQQDFVPHRQQRTSTDVRVIPRRTRLLHCDNRANHYKSQRSWMRNAYPRSATLADFVFALIGLCIYWAPPPMDTYFPTDRGTPTAVSQHCTTSFTCASCHFFPQRPVVEWYERSALK